MADATGLRARVRERAREIGGDAADQVRQALVGAAPRGETGETARSVRVDELPEFGNRLAWRAVAPTPQAEWTDKGTRPHPISPIPNRPNAHLRFVIPGVGVIFTKKTVHHPGTTGTGWFTDTVRDEWAPALRRATER